MTIERAPELTGPRGSAWEWVMEQDGVDMRDRGCLGAWLVHRPDAHPHWSYYLLSVAHLRPIEGMREPYLKVPGSTHEIMLIALDPNFEPNPDALDPHLLTPPNLGYQVENASDEEAVRIARLAVQAYCDGMMNPDTDHRSHQEDWIQKCVASIMSAN